MSPTATKPNKFNEIFESANRLRTVRKAPNPFITYTKDNGRIVKRKQTGQDESTATDGQKRVANKS
jgi:hypothetical protein